MTSSGTTWAEYVRIRSRYQRSVHLQRDAKGANWLEGYVITPLGRSVLGRIAAGLRPDGTARSWSITGPYGSGKSAFALFLSQVLATEGLGDAKAARKLLDTTDRQLKNALYGAKGALSGESNGLCPVVATGERDSLESILVRALHEGLQSFWDKGRKPEVLSEVESALAELSAGNSLSPRRVTTLFELAAKSVRESKRLGEGLLVILDEAGKPLEHVVASRGHSDIHLLQELAELANRSGDTPIVFVVLLHQAFDSYAARLSASQRNEWTKVQGRFEDVPFQEPSDQVLRLIGAAIDRDDLPAELLARSQEAAAAVARLCDASLASRSEDLEGSLVQTTPLHPTSALALGPLFRSRLAQNERSLFAFLASSEPRGFQEFLHQTAVNGTVPLFGLTELYDYVTATFGERLYGSQSRIWAQIDTALHRLPADAEAVDARVVKVVGLLSIVGEAAGLSPSLDVIHQAVWQKKKGKASTQKALERLLRASILIHRKFKNAYQLWDGSDLDLDGLLEAARAESSPYANLSARLGRLAPPRPLVARKHFHTTGTFRYFEVRYADERLVLEDREFVPEGCKADGIVWIVLPTSESAESQVDRALLDPVTWGALPNPIPVLVGLPARRSQLLHLLDDLAGIDSVEANTPELQTDPVARRELAGRKDEALHLLREELQSILTTGGNARWYEKAHFAAAETSTSSLTSTVSKLCDLAYDQAPIIKSELLNRSQLSSAAAAARRVLMTAMVEASGKERLGMEGYPPEYSMYRSLLERQGMHKKSLESWALTAPDAKRVGSLQGAWRDMNRLFEGAGDARVPLQRLYARLAAPPFGIKAGVLPVVALAYFLTHADSIALYEDGVFYPEIDAPFLERMSRAPHTIEVQNVASGGERAELLDLMTPVLRNGEPTPRVGTLEVARFLMNATLELPDFAKQTKRLSKSALSTRTALVYAKDPSRLIFQQLPEALGFPQLSQREAAKSGSTAEFIEELRSSLKELYQAYPSLLSDLRTAIADKFHTGATESTVRTALAPRAQIKLPKGANQTLCAFMDRVLDDSLPLPEWTESIGTLLVGKPPRYWYDRDLDEFLIRLGHLAIDFAELESLALASSERAASQTELLRLSLRHSTGDSVQHILVPYSAQEKSTHALRESLATALQSEPSGLTRDQKLAVLAHLCEDLLST
ncbi:MAG: hypothetical protein H6828_07445 [Planctomycetes bacterium]|nr:hypothetical protein [Planctomycetota bacterium]